jgi:hypothetical protein
VSGADDLDDPTLPILATRSRHSVSLATVQPSPLARNTAQAWTRIHGIDAAQAFGTEALTNMTTPATTDAAGPAGPAVDSVLERFEAAAVAALRAGYTIDDLTPWLLSAIDTVADLSDESSNPG